LQVAVEKAVLALGILYTVGETNLVGREIFPGSEDAQ
jgi:hypothetical protein